MTLSFSDPEETGGIRLNPRDIVGHLLLVWVVDYVAHSPTQYSRPDKPSDVIIVDVVDLDQVDEFGRPGLLARKAWWRQAQLIQSLKPRVGEKSPVLAKMDKGGAAMGRTAPFVLTNMKGDQQSVARAQAWAAANPGFTASTPNQVPTAPVQDPWNQGTSVDPGSYDSQQQLPPPRPVTQQELTVLERMARSTVGQGQGPVPF